MGRRRSRRTGGEDGAAVLVGGVVGSVFVVAVLVAVAVAVRAGWEEERLAASGSGQAPPPAAREPEPRREATPQPRPDPQPQPTPRKPAQPAGPPPAPAGPPAGFRSTKPEGGAFADIDYREYPDDGSVLVGFQLGLGKVFDTDIIAYLRPIWMTREGEKLGTAYGRTANPITTVRAKDGYAVGGVVVAGGGALEGIAFTFMRWREKSLDPKDWYTSDWYGERRRRPRPEQMRGGDGGMVVGFYGKRFADKGGPNYDDGGAIATIGLLLWAKE